ncbi:hypothetical protein BGZ82_004125 [Podila clonocystis]|nr:hypothetical protein BGZ82_004125 [Podila clonocystis]
MSTAALDIALIVETICHHLSLPEIRACQQVSQKWSDIFQPHPWRVTKLTVTTPFPRKKLYTIIRNIPWIQSLTVAAIHLHKIALVHFSHLQELTLYDDNYGNSHNEGTPVCADTVCRLIGTSTELKGLEINLNRYHYRSKRLVPSLMLAIAKHPSLIKWTWTVTDDILSHDYSFEQALLYVCHQGSIQELNVHMEQNPDSYCSGCGAQWNDGLIGTFSAHSMDLVQDDSPEYMVLRANLDAETSLDQLGGPFAFKKLFMDYHLMHYYKDLLRLCPDLRYANVHRNTLNSDTESGVDILVESCPDLRGFSVRRSLPDLELPSDIGRFSRLQQIEFECWDESTLASIVSALAQTHLESLEIITTHHTSVSVCASDHQSLDMVVREWDSPLSNRNEGDMYSWWYSWEQAHRFMDEFSKAYVKRREQPGVRPVHMRFMLPLKHHMPLCDAVQYSNIVEEGPEGRRQFTLKDAQRMARESFERNVDRLCGFYYESETEDDDENETQGFDQEYEMSKSRNRHHTLRDKKRSVFRRPFKK